jgi:hypothetical protein
MTAATVNKELKKLGIPGKMVRGKGYYYFTGCLFDIVPSLYACNLSGFSVGQIIEYITTYYKKI